MREKRRKIREGERKRGKEKRGRRVRVRERERRLVKYWSKLAFCILVIVLNENIRLDCQKNSSSKDGL